MSVMLVCPSKRYIGLSVYAYNLRKICAELISQEIKAHERVKQAA